MQHIAKKNGDHACDTHESRVNFFTERGGDGERTTYFYVVMCCSCGMDENRIAFLFKWQQQRLLLGVLYLFEQ